MWELTAYNRGDCIFSARFHEDDIEWRHIWAALGQAIYRQKREPYSLQLRVLSPQAQLTP